MKSKQHIPRILEREFPASDDRAAAQAILATYGQEARHSEIERVRIAALKLAKGNLKTLRETVDAASVDYRDVLAWAENPRLMKKPTLFAEDQNLYNQIAAQDEAEYSQWLNQPSST